MTRLPGRLVLLGHPVAHSLSPAFQNAALRAAGLATEYEALDVAPADLAATLDALRRAQAAGNVTIPHKAAMLAACAEITGVARRAGAVNTFWTRDDGTLAGDNTDVAGVEAAVRALLPSLPDRADVAVLGAGGAAAAVLTAAGAWGGGALRLWSRRPEAARSLAERFPGVAMASESEVAAVRGAALVVNATPVGMRDDAQPCPVEWLDPGATVLDLVYRRGETPWVLAARGRGHAAADGLGMLLEQGALSFERWFGLAPDRAAMRASVA
ncbi:MAG: shikimate dehydrogenase [Gemmatimonadetes bacterium]|nr:shikimate dehydrogenase [Gemmatimonadota bacterium]